MAHVWQCQRCDTNNGNKVRSCGTCNEPRPASRVRGVRR